MCDQMFDNFAMGLDYEMFEMRPSAYFHENMAACYFSEHLSPSTIEEAGVGNLLFETDFPHTQCLNIEQIAAAIELAQHELSESVREALLFGNAARLYGVEMPWGEAPIP
jgi:predicted TIM-barrel fold metal-dependent hydrolase